MKIRNFTQSKSLKIGSILVSFLFIISYSLIARGGGSSGGGGGGGGSGGGFCIKCKKNVNCDDLRKVRLYLINDPGPDATPTTEWVNMDYCNPVAPSFSSATDNIDGPWSVPAYLRMCFITFRDNDRNCPNADGSRYWNNANVLFDADKSMCYVEISVLREGITTISVVALSECRSNISTATPKQKRVWYAGKEAILNQDLDSYYIKMTVQPETFQVNNGRTTCN